MPEPPTHLAVGRRTAGTGSLGRPRWLASAEWRGASILREAKAIVPSAWTRMRGRGSRAIRCGTIAAGAFRAPDPWYRVADGIVVRRLSPNNRKIEAAEEAGLLLRPDVLQAMGFELASVHLGTGAGRAAIERDLQGRRQKWLLADAGQAVAAVERDHKRWRRA